jgi:hypothetical protein
MSGRNVRQLARYAATRVVGLAALGGLTALGVGSLGAGSATAAARNTNENAPVASTVRFSVSLHVQMPKQYAIVLSAQGQMDFVHHALMASVVVPTPGLQAAARKKAGSLTTTKPVRLTGKWVGGHVYVMLPASLAALVHGVHEVSVPVTTSTGHQVDTALDQSAVALSYAKILLTDLAGHQAQHALAPRKLNGVAVTGTQVDLTLGELVKVVPGLAPVMQGEDAAMASQTIPVTVWIDHHGRLVEATMATKQGSPDLLNGTVKFSDYDAAAHITAPPAGSATPIPASLKRLLSGLNPFGDVTPA